MTRKTQKRKARKSSKLYIWAYISGMYQQTRAIHKAALKRFFAPGIK